VVHVRDASHPVAEEQREDVENVLRSLGVGELVDAGGLIEVLNKIDLLPEEEKATLAIRAGRGRGDSLLLSARSGEGCSALVDTIDARLGASMPVIDVRLTPEDGATLAWLYRHGEVLKRSEDGEGISLQVRLESGRAARFARRQEEPLQQSARPAGR